MRSPSHLVLALVVCAVSQAFAAEKVPDSVPLAMEHRGLNLLSPGPLAPPKGVPIPQGTTLQARPLGPGPAPGPAPAGRPPANSDEVWPASNPADMPQIKNLQVQCEKTHMRVNIEFDRPFYGMIFSKGHYNDPTCVHVRPGSGQLSATFDIYLNSCGMTSSASQGIGGGYGQPSPAGAFVENTVIIQYDALVQEVWDQARRLRCTWYDYYEKSVTFRPFSVDMLNAVTANFLGDNLQCWMQIQVGKGPWASEVSGIVKIGQTMTMVLAIKDDDNKFDMLVRNCVAHDGIRSPIQLVDQNGCVIRPKIMSKFQKVRNFGPSASVVSYAYFQAFKFPDSMNVHFQCVIQVCRYNCPEPQCDGRSSAAGDLGFAASNNVVTDSKALPVASPPKPVKAQKSAAAAAAAAPPAANQARPAGFVNINREGEASSTTDKKLDRLLFGKPRAAEESPAVAPRPKRDAEQTIQHVYRRDTQEMTDVRTARIIQVVSPGDVAFTLNLNQNETVVIQNIRDVDGNNICLSMPSFIGGLTMMLVVFVVACIVATFVLLRVRQYNKKGKLGSISSLVYEKDKPAATD